MLLRCAQEIITNAVRHAGASHLWLSARREDGRIAHAARATTAAAPTALVAGNGLRGMRERLAAVWRRARDRTPGRGQGFCLHLTLPASAPRRRLPKERSP